jgi:Cephalosporin hydroxylase
MIDQFDQESRGNIRKLGEDREAHALSQKWIANVLRHKYSHHFKWLGRPIIQFPQDIVAIQEIIWEVKPDLIIETGIARGGSLIFLASMLELLGGSGHVVGVDVDIREHNRIEIERHPLFRRITMIEGSSIDPKVFRRVQSTVAAQSRVMVILDSNHTHEHVTTELETYASLVTKGSYLVVLDTVIEDLPEDFFPDRPWGKGNNPKTAVWQFLGKTDRFVIDEELNHKLLITVAPDGYLRCVKN